MVGTKMDHGRKYSKSSSTSSSDGILAVTCRGVRFLDSEKLNTIRFPLLQLLTHNYFKLLM